MLPNYNPRRPVRPPVLLDQLAAQWVADWSKKHSRRPTQPITTDEKSAPVAVMSSPTSASLPTKHKSAPHERRQMIRNEAIHRVAVSNAPTNLQMSQKMGAARYYTLTATSLEADLRNKWYTGSRAGRDARTFGRKPRADRRTVTVASFRSSVSLRRVRRTFAALATAYSI